MNGGQIKAEITRIKLERRTPEGELIETREIDLSNEAPKESDGNDR